MAGAEAVVAARAVCSARWIARASGRSSHSIAPRRDWRETGSLLVIVLEIIVLALLVLLNGFLAMSELALVSSRRPRLERLAAEGRAGARIALELAADPGRFLATVQVGLASIGIFAGAFSGVTLAQRIDVW